MYPPVVILLSWNQCIGTNFKYLQEVKVTLHRHKLFTDLFLVGFMYLANNIKSYRKLNNSWKKNAFYSLFMLLKNFTFALYCIDNLAHCTFLSCPMLITTDYHLAVSEHFCHIFFLWRNNGLYHLKLILNILIIFGSAFKIYPSLGMVVVIIIILFKSL